MRRLRFAVHNWHATFYDDETRIAYRVRVKRLTVGDAVAADMLSDDVSRRDELQGRELLTLARLYPLLRYATSVCEYVPMDEPPQEKFDTGDPVLPDDVEWKPFNLTESAFMALPEWFVVRWQVEAIRKNPHRDPTYEALKKKWESARQPAMKAPITDSGTTSATANASGSSSA
ncbi:MAG: hypothetical protein ACYTEQ_06490 [Planctomycetota bacterium]|jgi:hypothetical protein